MKFNQGCGRRGANETVEEMVVYRALYGEGGLWVRSAQMFFETIERDVKRMKRFELLKE